MGRTGKGTTSPKLLVYNKPKFLNSLRAFPKEVYFCSKSIYWKCCPQMACLMYEKIIILRHFEESVLEGHESRRCFYLKICARIKYLRYKFYQLHDKQFCTNFNSVTINLTLNPLTCKIWWAPNNASRRQMGFESAFKGLNIHNIWRACIKTSSQLVFRLYHSMHRTVYIRKVFIIFLVLNAAK